MGNIISIHHRTPANAPERAFDSMQSKQSHLSPRETARVLCGFSTARASQGVRAFSSQAVAQQWAGNSAAVVWVERQPPLKSAEIGVTDRRDGQPVSKFTGKTQVGEPKPGASALDLCQGAPGRGFLLVFLMLAACAMCAATAWAVFAW